MRQVAALFVDRHSVYKSLKNVYCWDARRDALTFPGGMPIVAHPPCRAWSTLRRFAHPDPGEPELTLWALYMVRTFGGVLEHPRGSALWRSLDVPRPGTFDAHGGFTWDIDQFQHGHLARKPTRLYICGCTARDLPREPLRFGEPTHVIGSNRRRSPGKLALHKAARHSTPRPFATWLVATARLCTP